MNSPISANSIGKTAPTSGSNAPSIKPSLKSTDEQKQEETTNRLTSATKTLFGQTSTISSFAANGMGQMMAMQSGMMKADLLKQAASGISELGSLGKLFEGMGKKNKGEEEESKRRIASNKEWGSAGGKEA